jgi:hypothetical protein
MVKGFPKRSKKAAVPEKEDSIRSERLALRAHRDLMRLLSLRASEEQITRSAMIERMLISYLSLDPRNPRLDPMGRIVEEDQLPWDARKADVLRAAERWQKFSAVHEILFGHPAPKRWFEDTDSYWIPEYTDGSR